MKSQKLLSILAVVLLSSGAGYAQQGSTIQNGSFESWHNYTMPANPDPFTVPDGWQGSDSMVAFFAPLASTFMNITINAQPQIFQTNDAHEGQSAAQLFSLNLGDSLGVQPAALTNGHISVDITGLIQSGGINPAQFFDLLTFKDGEVISGQVDSVSAWIKNGDSTTSTNGADFGFSAFALKQITTDSFAVVGEGAISIVPDLAQYTRVSLAISYDNPNVQPDRLVVVFTSNNPLSATPAPEYNSMKVDDVSYTMSATGIRLPLMTEDAAMVYPNPAADIVYFNLKSGEQAKNFDLRITDLTGQVISQSTFSHQVNGINVSQYARGIYFYQLTNTQTNQQQRGKLILK